MMNEILETYLRAHPDGVSAEAIAREVMLLKGPAAVIERIAAKALASSEGVVRGADGLYRLGPSALPRPLRGHPLPAGGGGEQGPVPARGDASAKRAQGGAPPRLAWSPGFTEVEPDASQVHVEPWEPPPVAPPDEVPAEVPDAPEPLPATPQPRVVALVARSTGRDPSVDVLLEVGAVELVGGTPSGRAVVGHVQPPRELPRQVLEAAGIDPRALRDGVPLEAMLARLATLLDGARLVCLGTDRGAVFLETALRRGGHEVAFDGVVLLWPLLAQAGLVSGKVRLDVAASALGVLTPERGDASTLAESLAEMTAAALERGLALEKPPPPLAFDFSTVNFDRAALEALPETPGIYRFLDRQRRVLYVGKARRLRQRVASYFAHRTERRQRHAELIEQLWDVQWEETGSELGALLAELREIRRHRPPINVQQQVRHRRKLGGSHVLFLPGADPGTIDLLLIRDGALVGQATTDGRGHNMALVRKALLRTFYTALPPREPDAAESALVASWLRQQADRHSLLDLSQVADLNEATRLVRNFVTDPELFRERLIHR